MATIRKMHSIATRTEATLLQDFIGAAALVVMLVVALHLPTLV